MMNININPRSHRTVQVGLREPVSAGSYLPLRLCQWGPPGCPLLIWRKSLNLARMGYKGFPDSGPTGARCVINGWGTKQEQLYWKRPRSQAYSVPKAKTLLLPLQADLFWRLHIHAHLTSLKLQLFMAKLLLVSSLVLILYSGCRSQSEGFCSSLPNPLLCGSLATIVRKLGCNSTDLPGLCDSHNSHLTGGSKARFFHMASPGPHHSPIEYEAQFRMRSWLFFFFPPVSEMVFPACGRGTEGGAKARAWNWMLWHLAFNTRLAAS